MKRLLLFLVLLFSVSLVVKADDMCELALNSANEYFKNGNYETALKMYNLIVDHGCGANYGGVSAKIKECKRILQEDADYKKCYSIKGCDEYLKKYPKGKHFAEVQRKRSKLVAIEIVEPAEDDAAFNRCYTESDCDEYLQKYPRGRHIDAVLAMKAQFQEEREAIEAALRLEREEEASKTAFMDIQTIEFANLDAKKNVLTQFGETLYVGDLRLLTPRIVYEGIYDLPEIVTVCCKLYDPNGELKTAPDSPEGYTIKNSFLVKPGENNTFQLSGYGNKTTSIFISGDYVYELWYQDSLLYQTLVEIKDKGEELTQDYWRRALIKCCDYPTQSYKAGSYKGQIKGYDRSGYGMYSWNNGAYYIGEWKAAVKDGTGIDIAPSGYQIPKCPQCEYYVGDFSGNVKSGTGRCYDKFGNLIYQGKFANDAPTQAYPNQSDKSLKFECFDYSMGCYYIGETKNGKCHGKGVLVWRRKGEMWYGNFVNGERSGNGVFMPYEGEVSTGVWKGDVKQ